MVPVWTWGVTAEKTGTRFRKMSQREIKLQSGACSSQTLIISWRKKDMRLELSGHYVGITAQYLIRNPTLRFLIFLEKRIKMSEVSGSLSALNNPSTRFCVWPRRLPQGPWCLWLKLGARRLDLPVDLAYLVKALPFPFRLPQFGPWILRSS